MALCHRYNFNLPVVLKRVAYVLLMLAAALHAQESDQQEKVTPISLSANTIYIKTDSTVSSYSLADSFLIEDSEIVQCDSVVLKREQDYTMDYLHGRLKLSTVLSHGKTLRVSYRRLPVLLSLSYANRPVLIARDSSAAVGQIASTAPMSSAKPAPTSGSGFGAKLRNSGSIHRAVSVGSDQRLQVDSGLRFQISGNLTDDLEVIASLSDQNTPIQPEGNTQSLQEIDKVFIQLKGPHVDATLGDYHLNFQGTAFTNYSRKLQGAMAQAEFGRMSATVSGAVSKGKFTTNEFSGQEGNQGPYQLTGPEGQVNIIVLAGTERVWVDGELMTRGEDFDYVIEYGNGQITFSRSRLITADSRITVDFQFSDESFQRSYWSGRAKSGLFGNKVALMATFLRESDDKDNPLAIPLTDRFREALESAGDSTAVLQGDSFVGEGRGTYLQDSTGVFIYAGPNEGDHEVRFSFVGRNKGEYVNIGLGRFEFAGKNRGSYQPQIILPKAQRHDVVGFNLQANPVSAVRVSGEFAFSQLDRNLYSNRDDADNQGVAYLVDLNVRPVPIKIAGSNLGRFSLRSYLRQKDARFRDIDRTHQVEFNRRWNVPDTAPRQESVQEIRGEYLPVEGLALAASIGHLSKSTLLNSRRWDLHTTLDRKGLPRFEYFIESIDRKDLTVAQTSAWLRQRGAVELDWWKFQPIMEYQGESKRDEQPDSSGVGFQFGSYTAGLRFTPWKQMSTSVRYNYRDDKDRVNGSLVPKSQSRTISGTWALHNWHAITASTSFTHRERDFADISVQDTRTDLADLRISYAPRSGALRGNWYYQLSNTAIAKQEELFLEVGEGEGNYRFNEELNEFEPDPFGNYVRQLVVTQDFIPVIELKTRADFRLDFARLFRPEGSGGMSALKSLLRPLSTETFVRIDERSTEPDVSKIYLLDLSYFRQDGTTILGSLEFREDLYLWRNSPGFSLRYRYRSRSELNNQLTTGGQEREVREQRIRLQNRLSNLVTSRIEGFVTHEDRLFDQPGREDRRIRIVGLDLDLAYRPRSRLELGVQGILSVNKDLVPDPITRANVISLVPRVNYSLNTKGRFRAEFGWTRVSVEPQNRLIPFELTNGNRAGTTLRWNVGIDYRFSKNIQTSFSYLGRDEPDRPQAQHVARLEMRAFF